MTRTTLCLAILAGAAAPVLAQSTLNSVAVETGTIMPNGPRPPVNGDRFFNVEGAANGTFASYGVARWNLAGMRASFDAECGAGNWVIDSVELEMTQDNAAFSVNGGILVYYSTDDATDVKSGASPLTYPFFDGVNFDMALGNGNTPILTYNFSVTATGDLDRYTQAGSFKNGALQNAGEVLSLAPDFVADLTTDNTLTLVFVENDPIVAGTYRGQEEFLGRVGPNLFVTVVCAGSGPCYANCDQSTVAPVLNVGDFTCFLQRFAAGEAYANCDQSTVEPTLNVGDFTCFLQSFAAGCP